MMKKRYSAVLASAAALALMLSACAGDTGSSQSVGSGSADSGASSSVSSGASSSVSSGAQSTDDSAQPEAPVNKMVFMHGANLPGMTVKKNENYADGTYWYEDLTEDKMVTFVNRAVPTDPSWLEIAKQSDTPWANVIWDAIDGDAYDIWGGFVGEETLYKGPYETFYAEWTIGRNEDAQSSHGVMLIDDDFTYFYYMSTDRDNYVQMINTFPDLLDQVQLEPIKG